MIFEICLQEGRKLFAQKYSWILIGAMLALVTGRMLASALTPPFSSLDVLSAPQLWAQGAGWGLQVMVFLVLMFGAMGFSQEFSLGTAKTMLVLPLERWVWFAAKLFSLLLLAWAMLLVVAGLGIIITALTTGWGAVMREGVELYSTSVYWGYIALAIALTALFLMAVCAFGLLIGLHFTHSGPAVGVALLSGMVLESIAGLFEEGRYIFVHPLHQPVLLIGKLGRGAPFSFDDVLVEGVAVSLISFLIFSVWAWARLERMDIAG